MESICFGLEYTGINDTPEFTGVNITRVDLFQFHDIESTCLKTQILNDSNFHPLSILLLAQ